MAENAVVYDNEDKDTVTFGGENGTLLTNVADGAVTATSMDAINGRQLYGALDSTAQILGGGAAVDAGLQAGDVVTAFNGVPVTYATDLTAQVRAAAAGSDGQVGRCRRKRQLYRSGSADRC